MDKNFIEALIAAQTVSGVSGEDDVARGLAANAQTAAENAQNTANGAQSAAEGAQFTANTASTNATAALNNISKVVFFIAGATLAIEPSIRNPKTGVLTAVSDLNALGSCYVMFYNHAGTYPFVDASRFIGAYATGAATFAYEPVKAVLDITDLGTMTGSLTLSMAGCASSVVGTITGGAITWALST